MKIYHIADIHLASPMEQLGEKAIQRRDEIFDTFSRAVRKARAQGVKVILLSGDVFDCKRPLLRDKKQFYSLIEDFGEIDFLYLRGNHDVNQSYDRTLPNLKTFMAEGWTYLMYDNVCIAGAELNNENFDFLAENLTLHPGTYNIVMMHGQIDGEKSGVSIKLDQLKNKNIDYLALGHIHSYKSAPLDARGVWAYSGCLEGRGYDEVGKKGFIEIDTESHSHRFIPFATREVKDICVDLSKANTTGEALDTIAASMSSVDTDDMVKLQLIGDLHFDFYDVEQRVKARHDSIFHLKVSDQTRKYISIEDYEKRNSLIGEFIRIVRDDMSLTEADRQEIYRIGIEALTHP